MVFANIHHFDYEDRESLKYEFSMLFREAFQMLSKSDSLMEISDHLANTVFESMTHSKVFYHTPIHIFKIFNFAKKHKIKLTFSQKLALLLHDAYYRTDTQNMNEEISTYFIEFLMIHPEIPISHLFEAKAHILDTAKHLDSNNHLMNAESKLVMDLDMSGFAESKTDFLQQNKLIELEYSHVPKDKLYAGRLNFLTSLKNKKSIYRTDYFLKNFEQKAQDNLNLSIYNTLKQIEKL